MLHVCFILHLVLQLRWNDSFEPYLLSFCVFNMVRFCPHDLFVNTGSDLGEFYVIPKIQVALIFLLEHSIMNQKNILNHMSLYFILGMGKTEPVMLLSCS